MTLARDAIAAEHLIYAWPLPIGADCDVTCSEDEQVVMCPAWMVGDRLGPGHHKWKSPDPMRPVSAYFVRTTPVPCTFDMTTSFMIPATRQPVRLRATGMLEVRCADPGLLVAQFVGLPFDQVNDGVLRSVARSLERMLARLLTRRVVTAGTPAAVTDPAMLPAILEELVAYNPTAGSVFGLELVQIGELVIGADDGSSPFVVLPNREWSGQVPRVDLEAEPPTDVTPAPKPDDVDLTETARGRPKPNTALGLEPAHSGGMRATASSSGEIRSGEIRSGEIRSGEIGGGEIRSGGEVAAGDPPVKTPRPSTAPGVASVKATQRHAAVPPANAASSGEIVAKPESRPRAPTPPETVSVRAPSRPGSEPIAEGDGQPVEPRGSILGIGVSHIGAGEVASGEIPEKVKPGKRVLVPGPNGLMQSATVRQLLQGYYELEVGSSGETIWVPIANVVPEAP